MALCHPSLQDSEGKLIVLDAENAWFLRFNHIAHYGTDPYWEGLCCHPGTAVDAEHRRQTTGHLSDLGAH